MKTNLFIRETAVIDIFYIILIYYYITLFFSESLRIIQDGQRAKNTKDLL